MPDSCFANWPGSRSRLADWYETPLGVELDRCVHECLRELLADVRGQHGLQVGAAARGDEALVLANIGHHLLLRGEPGDALQAEPEHLPLASGSLNLLVLFHVVEYRDSPQALFMEAERVLAPEGRLLVVAFNPSSLFGLRRVLPHDGAPWHGAFPGLLRLHWWCRRAELKVEELRGCWRRPPAHGHRLRALLYWLERGPRLFDYWGAIHVLRARKRRVPVTPVRLESRWRRWLHGLQPARPGVSRLRAGPAPDQEWQHGATEEKSWANRSGQQ